MTEIRIKGPQAGSDLGTVSATIGAETGSVAVNAFQVPPAVSGLPRISSGQFATDTLALDTTGLTGITAYDWREVGGATIGIAAMQMGMGHMMKWIECEVTCDQGVLVSPAVMIYMPMDMASHNADDVSLLALVPHHEATHIAVVDGAWTQPSTWLTGIVPRNGARVLIPHGVTVTYDQHRYYRLDWIRNDGTLTASRSKSTFALFETLVNTRGARFECGTGAARLLSQYKSEWVISNRTCRTENRFPSDINLANDPKLLGRGILNQGERVMWGAHKTAWLRTEPGGAPMQGDTQAVLSAIPSGWAVGDTIIIGGTGNTEAVETETRTITGISGGMVSWSGGLIYDHDHRNLNVSRTDLQPGVANLTRNIVIRSESPDVPPHQRGHTMDMHMMCHLDLWDVEHYDLGRTIKNLATPAGKMDENGDFKYYDQVVASDAGAAFQTEAMTAQSNIQSRYVVHFHLVGFGKGLRDTVNNCTVRNAPGWGIVHHGCEAFMNSNIISDFEGAGMVSETGNEAGEWLNNFVLGAKNKTSTGPKNSEFRRGLKGDFFRDGHAFAMRSRAIRCNANFAQDASWGFVFYHRTDTGSITPSIDHLTPNLDLKDLQGFYNSGTMPMADYPIVHVNDNESAGMIGGGFFVTKPFAEQDHGLNVNIKRFKSWGFGGSGFMVEYIGQYALTDLDISAPAANGLRYGIFVSANNAQVSVVRPKTERCAEGIHFDGTDAVTGDENFDASNEPRFMVVAHTSLNDTTPIVYGKGSQSVTKVYVTEPTYIEPSHNLPFKIGEFDRGAAGELKNVATGVLTDTVSANGAIPKPADLMGMPVAAANNGAASSQWFSLRTYLQTVGYYLVGGVAYAVFPKYFSDRVTGNWVKTWHGVEVIGSLGGYIDNGDYVLSASAPVVSPASLSVVADGSGTIDILALASDADGGTLSLSESYFAPDRGRFEISGGSVTYTPDPGYTGPDKAQVVVEDGQGHATRVDLAIAVS